MLVDAFRKFMLAGFGAKEKLTELVDDLIKKGELSESQGAKVVKEWTEKAEKSTAEFEKTLSEIIPKTLEKMNIPNKEDMEKIDNKIQSLMARLEKLEGASNKEE